jgi:ferric-dicitrate binding protein FerR (iron transport regulator)
MEPGPDHDRRRATARTAQDATQNAALADLARLQHESDALGGLFGRARDHFAAADAPTGDPAELWGRRIGRILSAAAFIALAAYLYLTYVR